jgi:hypothetical protein
VKEMGEKQTRMLGEQKQGGIKKGQGTSEGKKKQKKQKSTLVGQGLQLGFIQMDGLKTEKLGGALGGVLDHSCPSSGFIYLLALRRDTLYLSFFLSFSKTFLNSHFYCHNL